MSHEVDRRRYESSRGVEVHTKRRETRSLFDGRKVNIEVKEKRRNEKKVEEEEVEEEEKKEGKGEKRRRKFDKMYKILRRGSGRVFVVCVVVLSLLLCIYYVNQAQTPSTASSAAILNEELRYDRSLTSITPDYSEVPDSRISLATCPVTESRHADIDAQREFEKFDFQVNGHIHLHII